MVAAWLGIAGSGPAMRAVVAASGYTTSVHNRRLPADSSAATAGTAAWLSKDRPGAREWRHEQGKEVAAGASLAMAAMPCYGRQSKGEHEGRQRGK